MKSKQSSQWHYDSGTIFGLGLLGPIVQVSLNCNTTVFIRLTINIICASASRVGHYGAIQMLYYYYYYIAILL